MAIDRFEAAGSTLPDREVRSLDDPDVCRGQEGLFDHCVALWQVLICSDLPVVLPRELAHEWAWANLDDAARARYVPARGLPTRGDHRFEWGDRGVEDAAFIGQQHLTATGAPMTSPRGGSGQRRPSC